MNLNEISNKYLVRKLTQDDIDDIYALSSKNKMYYQYCPPFVTKESILDDMKALPPGIEYKDKYYIGFFENQSLVAIMDLILHYPNSKTVFIGFFMMDVNFQGKGTGTAIIKECLQSVKEYGYAFARLGYAKGNPQSEAFWTKLGFRRTGIEVDKEDFIAVVMEKEL